MKKFYEKVCKLEELIALILVAGIAVLVFVSALMRTIGHPLNWAQDVADLPRQRCRNARLRPDRC